MLQQLLAWRPGHLACLGVLFLIVAAPMLLISWLGESGDWVSSFMLGTFLFGSCGLGLVCLAAVKEAATKRRLAEALPLLVCRWHSWLVSAAGMVAIVGLFGTVAGTLSVREISDVIDPGALASFAGITFLILAVTFATTFGMRWQGYLKTLAVGSPVKCYACDYNLRGLPGERKCPECGVICSLPPSQIHVAAT